MEAQANTTREQINKKNIYVVGWRPSHGENGGVGTKKVGRCNYFVDASYLHLKNWQRKYKEGQCQIMKIELKIRAGANPMKLFTP